jgi:hypothetical protein
MLGWTTLFKMNSKQLAADNQTTVQKLNFPKKNPVKVDFISSSLGPVFFEEFRNFLIPIPKVHNQKYRKNVTFF